MTDYTRLVTLNKNSHSMPMDQRQKQDETDGCPLRAFAFIYFAITSQSKVAEVANSFATEWITTRDPYINIIWSVDGWATSRGERKR